MTVARPWLATVVLAVAAVARDDPPSEDVRRVVEKCFQRRDDGPQHLAQPFWKSHLVFISQTDPPWPRPFAFAIDSDCRSTVLTAGIYHVAESHYVDLFNAISEREQVRISDASVAAYARFFLDVYHRYIDRGGTFCVVGQDPSCRLRQPGSFSLQNVGDRFEASTRLPSPNDSVLYTLKISPMGRVTFDWSVKDPK